MASLEQYILVNVSSNSSCEIANSMMLSQLVHLYALVRSDPFSCQSLCSTEAEKSVFCLIAEMELDLFSIGLHPRAVKWFFQQEEIMKPLSYLVLNFCRSYSTNKAQICTQSNCIKLLDIQMIADLIVSGDNFVTELLVSLLKELEEGREDDISHLVNAMTDILNIFPGASDEFSLHGIAEALNRVFYLTHDALIIKTCSLFIFNVLSLANHETLSQDKNWLGILLKVYPIIFLMPFYMSTSFHSLTCSTLTRNAPLAM